MLNSNFNADFFIPINKGKVPKNGSNDQKTLNLGYKILIMETSVLRKKLQSEIETANDALLKKINDLIADFEYQEQQDLLMEEAEEDIREGRVYSIDEVLKEFEDRYKK